MREKQEFFGSDTPLSKYLVDGVKWQSAEKIEDFLAISKYDLEMTRTAFGEKLQAEEKRLHTIYRNALLVFAGICVAPFAGLYCGVDIPAEIGIGLGLGVAGCVGYAGILAIQYLNKTKKAESLLAEREETVEILTALATAKQSAETSQKSECAMQK